MALGGHSCHAGVCLKHWMWLWNSEIIAVCHTAHWNKLSTWIQSNHICVVSWSHRNTKRLKAANVFNPNSNHIICVFYQIPKPHNSLLYVKCKYSQLIGQVLVTWPPIMVNTDSKCNIDQAMVLLLWCHIVLLWRHILLLFDRNITQVLLWYLTSQ